MHRKTQQLLGGIDETRIEEGDALFNKEGNMDILFNSFNPLNDDTDKAIYKFITGA